MNRNYRKNSKNKNKGLGLDDLEHTKTPNAMINFLSKNKGIVLIVLFGFLFFFGAAVCSYLRLFGLI